MTVFFPGPFEVRIPYIVTLGGSPLLHTQRLNCDPTTDPAVGTAFSSINLNTRSGGTRALDDAVDAWVAILAALYTSGTCSIQPAQLFKYTPDTFETTFISDYTPAAPSFGSGPALDSLESIYTFTTFLGHKMKIVFLEANNDQGDAIAYGDMFADQKAPVDYLLADDAPWIARDNSFAHTFHLLFPGQSEVTFKQRHR